MKKTKIRSALTAALCVFALTGCTASDNTPKPENVTNTTTTKISTTAPVSTTASAGTTASENTTVSATAADTGAPDGLNTVKLSEGIYSLGYSGDYFLDQYLEADIKTVEELDSWFMENLTDGISTEGSEYDTACSTFTVTTDDDKHIFGRNYDIGATDAMFILTVPENDYSSIGIVDLSHLNIGQGCENAMGSGKSQTLLKAAPYCISDGINEKGLGVSLLKLDNRHSVNDTDKHDLLVYISLRALLDKCADVNEAVDFLSEYDIYSPSAYSYHIFLTDKSGRSAVAEWIDGELTIVEDDAATNFILFEAPPTRLDARYVRMRKALDDKSVSSKDDAMNLLESVSQKHATSWTAVYDLGEFTVEACFNEDYDNKYEFGF